MKRIEISVQNLVAWQTNSTDYICGNSKFVVGFNFDKEWDEFETKTARFIHGGEHTDIVFTGNECKVPKITNTKRIEIGVYAGNLQTTTPAVIQCRKSILCGFGVPADPPPDVYAQIMERLDNGVSEEQIAKTVEKYMEEHPIESGVEFETDNTLILENGVLSVNTTNQMEQDNTLPMTSAGVYAAVGNIEALLKTI